jgi:mRNA-degrading endonuclease RelE of RelBE toxin-antitoxin system
VSGAIRQRLREIADKAGEGRSRPKKPTIVKEPPLRSHVYDGYQMLYQIDVQTRRVVVLDFGPLPTARAQPRSARAAAGRRRASRSAQAV